MRLLNDEELAAATGGEVITLAAVMAVLAIALVAVIAYRIFRSKQGSAKFPGGFTFEWK